MLKIVAYLHDHVAIKQILDHLGLSPPQDPKPPAQYIAHPDWPWFRLRKETPSRYESYVDLVPGAWTKVKIEVDGAKARLYVHDQQQPVLIVNGSSPAPKPTARLPSGSTWAPLRTSGTWWSGPFPRSSAAT